MYGFLIAMYLVLAIMARTVWLRLESGQEYIQVFVNAIFAGSAFMSYKATTCVPAYLEDRSTFVDERSNWAMDCTILTLL